MNQPKVQADITDEGAGSDNNPTGDTPHGIPKDMDAEDATGTPTSDRGAAEMAVKDTGKG